MLYSSTCEYAVRALTFLASAPPQALVRLTVIAEAEDLPAPYLGKVFRDLSRAGVLHSAKGPRGGYRLARSADSITLLDVKRVIDGVVDLERCAVGLGQCSDLMPCPQHVTFKPLREAIRRYLATTTLSDMAAALERKRGRKGAAASTRTSRAKRTRL